MVELKPVFSSLMLQEALIWAIVIQAIDWGIPFKVMYDASNFALGVMLGQMKDNKPYAIYYAS